MITLTFTEQERKQLLFELNSAKEVVLEANAFDSSGVEELQRIDMLIAKIENKPE